MTDKEYVLKRKPNCRLVTMKNGECYVLDNEEHIIQDTYLIPYSTSSDEAWSIAKMCIQTSQNFNRTHPLKIGYGIMNPKDKFRFIKRRYINTKKQEK